MKYDRLTKSYVVPFSVNISVTEKCPLQCPMCFQPFDEKVELEIGAIYAFLDELSRLGTQHIQFSGGEPLLYPHLIKCILYAKKKGFITRISTSGVGLTNQMAEQLKLSGLDCCHISLNGSNAHIHEQTRCGFDETVKALKILSDSQVPTAINWVANHTNVPDLPNLIGFAKSNNVKYISILSQKKNNFADVLFPLSPSDLCTLQQYCQEYQDFLVVESCFDQLTALLRDGKINTVEHGCRAGRFYMAISARKEFLPCPHLYRPQKIISSIQDYWNADKELASLRHRSKTRQATACPNESR